jgi:hypothetical protein
MNCCRQDCNIEHLWDYVPNLFVMNTKMDLCAPTWWIVYFIWVVHELRWLHMLLEVSKTNCNKPLDILHTSHISKVELKMPVFGRFFLWLSLFSDMSLFRTSTGPLIESFMFYLLSELPLYSFCWCTHTLYVSDIYQMFEN